MKHLYSIIIVFFAATGVSFAQQTQLFSQHLFNRTFINPANAGVADRVEAVAFYRSQWVGLEGSPEYQSVTADLPLFDINSGVGLSFYNDALGVERNTAVYAVYAYHKSLGKGKLSVGLRAGWVQKGFDGSQLTTPGGQYNDNTQPVHNDGVIPNVNVSGGTPDVGLGVQYSTAEYFVGVSLDQLLAPSLQLQGGNTSPEIALRRHINLHAGYDFAVANRWLVTPTALVRSDFVKNQLDVAVVATYNRFIRFGAGYRGYNGRSQDAIIAILGLQLSEQWQFGYSYDYNISELANVNAGTHELFVRYQLPITRPRVGKIINNPRFLSF